MAMMDSDRDGLRTTFRTASYPDHAQLSVTSSAEKAVLQATETGLSSEGLICMGRARPQTSLQYCALTYSQLHITHTAIFTLCLLLLQPLDLPL